MMTACSRVALGQAADHLVLTANEGEAMWALTDMGIQQAHGT